MTRVPDFLAAFGLDADTDADERAIRRDYARRLKTIDPEVDPAAFQALREHRDQAIGFVNWRAQQRARESAEATSTAAPAPAPAPADAPAPTAAPATTPPIGEPLARPAATPMQDPTRAGERESPAAAAPGPDAPATPSAEQLAQLAFEAFRSQLGAGTADEVAIARALDAMLDDERLVHVDARTGFEYRVGLLLVEGWRPRHDLLFAAACRVFHWTDDPRRLRLFAQVGWFIDTAIRERLAFRGASIAPDSTVESLLDLLRAGPPASTSILLAQIRLLDAMNQRAPHWLAIMAPREQVQAWMERFRALPETRRRKVMPPPAAPRRTAPPAPATPDEANPRSAPARPPEPSRWSGSGGTFPVAFVVIALISTIGRFAGSDHGPGQRSEEASRRDLELRGAQVWVPPTPLPDRSQSPEDFAKALRGRQLPTLTPADPQPLDSPGTERSRAEVPTSAWVRVDDSRTAQARRMEELRRVFEAAPPPATKHASTRAADAAASAALDRALAGPELPPLARDTLAPRPGATDGGGVTPTPGDPGSR